ncbi:MAG: hypothetical protein K2X00_12435 [Nitrospiraceae bacterium]|jgi:hypothetical protein|nr:hypothetical protein [Nitrospiraceae bacterium]
MPRSYRQSDIELLWGLSAARCAFPECRRQLVQESTSVDPIAIVGEIAHINAYGVNGPRANPSIQPADVNKYPNLVLLCPTHHTVVDKQHNTYTAGDLIAWKTNHETWVRSQLPEEMSQVSFSELEVITKAIVNAPAPPTTNFTVLDPREKMSRNGLSREVLSWITLGLAQARLVGQFIRRFSTADDAFPERLKAGFVKKYQELFSEGLRGDELFEQLRLFACSGFHDIRLQAASLAVLAYLFESCEVFER